MIYILSFFCALNMILTSYFSVKIIYYIIFLEGIILIITTNMLKRGNCSMKKFFNNCDLIIVERLLLIISLIYIIAPPLYIINLIPGDTDIIILGSIPILLASYILNKKRKSIGKN